MRFLDNNRSLRKLFLLVFMVFFVVSGCGGDENDPIATCEGVTCSGHGSCEMADGIPTCTCSLGYAGFDCSSCAASYHRGLNGACVTDQSCDESNPCGYHGTCSDEGGEIVCTCDTGYTGESCAECAVGYRDDGAGICVMEEHCPALDPCGDHGTCVDDTGVVTCVCDTGYEGAQCDQCAFGYRDDGTGVCVVAENCPAVDVCGDHGECDDSSGMVVCVCDTGYAGVQCSQCADGYHREGELCTEDEVCPVPDTCGPNSSCDDSSGIAVCVCDDGYHPDELGNCLPDESCDNLDPCGEHGTCDDSTGSIECICDAGYRGVYCNSCAAGYHPGQGGDCIENETCPEPDPCGDHGTCDDSTYEVECQCDIGWAGEFCDTCEQGYEPDGQGNCVEIDNCYDYPFGSASYIYELRLNDPGNDGPCCFDYTGDGQPDNAFGSLVHQFAGLVGIDFNADLHDRIVSGEITELLEYPGLVEVQDYGPFQMPVFDGMDTDDDYDNNLTGQEQFFVMESAFVSDADGCTAEVAVRFEDVTILDNFLQGSAPVFSGLEIPVMPESDPTRVDLHDARINADMFNGVNGIEALNGKIGGVFLIDDFLTAMNTMYMDLCPCLNLDGDLMTWEIVGDQYEVTCADLSGQTCGAEDPPACEMIGMTCTLMGVMLQAADVDTNGDSVIDGFTVGMEFEATSAMIIGIQP